MYFDKQEFMECTNVPPIIIALCSMLSGTYYAHYASIIGGPLSIRDHRKKFWKQGKLPKCSLVRISAGIGDHPCFPTLFYDP